MRCVHILLCVCVRADNSTFLGLRRGVDGGPLSDGAPAVWITALLLLLLLLAAR